MPLEPGRSRAVVNSNIKEMIRAGYPQRQAVAASLSNARRHPKKYQTGGAASPTIGYGMGVPLTAATLSGATSPYGYFGASPDPNALSNYQAGLAGIASLYATPGRRGGENFVGPNSSPGENVRDIFAAARPRPDLDKEKLKGNARGGRMSFAMGGAPDFFAHRAFGEIHSAGMIRSPVGGRTDHIPVTVPSGSYVLPADHVSHLGQGNSLSGGKVLDHMFGLNAPGMAHLHSNIPHPPSPIMPHMRGGRATKREGEPVPIIVAGGEYLLHPQQVRRADEIVNKLPAGVGDLQRGHNALDQWVVTERKKHAKALQKLPGPKKD
jgi:hypothetical protein